MTRYLMTLSVFVAALLAGCGGPIETQAPEETLESVSSALVTCSTTCSSGTTLSCQGTTCSASNGTSVQCDGVYQYCASTCSSTNNCANIANKRCNAPGAVRSCCLSDGGGGTCTCVSGLWSCEIY